MATHDEIMELLGAYALDAVDADERDLVERHLAECPRCAAEVADHREVAAMMAYSGAPAPEGLWERIVGSLEESPPELDLSRAVRPASPVPSLDAARERRRPRLMVLALSAAAAVLVIGLVAGTLLIDDGADTTPETAIVSLESLAREALNDPDARQVTLESLEDDGLTATAAIEPDGSGYLLGTSLPALADDRTYQLWGQRGGVVVSLGVLGPSPGVVAFHAHPDTETLAITAEEAGGVPISQNPALLVGTAS